MMLNHDRSRLTGKAFFSIAVLVALYGCSTSSDEDEGDPSINAKVYSKACMAGAKPIITVADYNADGVVDNNDVASIESIIEQQKYFSLFDRNVDGVIDQQDVALTKSDLTKISSDLDKLIATLFDNVKELQSIKTPEELNDLGFQKGTSSLAGHGEHWLNEVGNDALIGREQTSFLRAEGINVAKDTGEVWAMFWGQNAVQVFENGATDFPQPDGQWMNSQVVSFAGTPPVFEGLDAGKWHTHAGLCITNNQNEIILNQHTTFAECQSMEDDERAQGDISPWLNIWMVHAWIFVPNPNGLFANTHPCLDSTSPAESTINGDRTVPHFFNHNH